MQGQAPFKMGLTDYPETSLTNYVTMLHNIPEEQDNT
jgi:hypothetical protein